MKLLFFGLALGLVVVAPASAMNDFGIQPNVVTPTVLAGSVSYEGQRLKGSGFSVEHVALGEYQIHVWAKRLRGCASIVASPESEPQYHSFYAVAANQIDCSRDFLVTTGYAAQYSDQNFHFIIVQE